MPVVARGQYDERPVFVSDLDFKDDPGVTKQSDARDCDINTIFRRFEKTGSLPDLIVRDGRYGDFSDVPTYQEACQIVRTAEEQFAALDVTIRNRFENDPSKFLAFATDPKNVDELEKMGLLKPEAVEARKLERKAEEEAAAAKYAADKDKAEKDLIAKVKAELQK